MSISARGLTRTPVQWVPRFLSGVLEVNRLSPSSAEGKNVWSYTAAPLMCHHVIKKKQNVCLYLRVSCLSVLYLIAINIPEIF
jgi:hypothetical protein